MGMLPAFGRGGAIPRQAPPVPVSVRATHAERIVFPDRVEARVGEPVSVRARVSREEGFGRWRLDGRLPKGLTFDPANGLLSGVPVAAASVPGLILTGFGGERVGRATFALEIRA